MELAQGGSLRRALDDESQALPWPLRARLLLEVAEGMRHLHRADAGHQPIVHRDLKAANVLLSSADLPRAVAKVADFGVAETTQTIQTTVSAAVSSVGSAVPSVDRSGGSATGTLPWKAWETFQKKYTEKSDVHAYGVTLFETVSRRLPFEGMGLDEIRNAVTDWFDPQTKSLQRMRAKKGVSVEEQREDWLDCSPLAERRPDIASQAEAGCPQVLLDLAARCWADAPRERPTFEQCAQALRAQLEAWAKEQQKAETLDTLLKRGASSAAVRVLLVHAHGEALGGAAGSQNKRIKAAAERGGLDFDSVCASTLQQCYDAMAHGRGRPDVVHFSGHGDGATLAFGDSSPRSEPLADLLTGRLLRPRCVVLNACHTSALAHLIHARAPETVVVHWKGKVRSSSCLELAEVLYEHAFKKQARGRSFREACDEAVSLFQATCADAEDCKLVAIVGNDDPERFLAPAELEGVVRSGAGAAHPPLPDGALPPEDVYEQMKRTRVLWSFGCARGGVNLAIALQERLLAALQKMEAGTDREHSPASWTALGADASYIDCVAQRKGSCPNLSRTHSAWDGVPDEGARLHEGTRPVS